jgi:hypothetical protein
VRADEAQAEVLEQCRINGMSAEREDALRAELTRLKASIALDKMADNARALGLDYEPPVQEGRDWSLLEATQESLREHMAEIKRLKAAQPAPVQEPVEWVPYLSDRADGVQGHYAIARWNPRGYREVWNLRRHAWGAFSDDVMSLEEADYLLQQITIPTRKPTSPALGPSMSITDRQIERALKAACMHSTTESRKDMRRAIEAAIDPVHEDDDQPIPDWWKLVPVEPTKEMIHRGRIDNSIQGCALAEACYRAMLAAAPKKDSTT